MNTPLTLFALRVAPERPDSAFAMALIAELEAVLETLCSHASQHGLSVVPLLVQQASFYVRWVNETPAGSGEIKICKDEAEVNRLLARAKLPGARRLMRAGP